MGDMTGGDDATSSPGDPGTGSEPDPAPEATRFRRWWTAPGRRLRLAGTLLTVLGLLGAGGVGGWWLHGRYPPSVEAPPVIEVDRPVIDLAGEPTEGTMPSLVGVSEEDARQAAFQLGLTEADLTVTAVPAAGQSGLVIGQEPAPGQAVDGGIVLEISAPADVPELVGQPEDDARATLADLGARVVVESRYEAGTAEGTVLATDPEAGQALVDAVTLTVASAPSSVFATQIATVENDCYERDVTAATVRYAQALTCSVSAGSDRVSVQEWVLNRQVSALEVVLSQDDRGTTGHQVVTRFVGDGQVIHEATAAFGASTVVSVPVEGVLRLRVEMSSPAAECCASVTAVLAEPRFVGSPAAIDALITSSGR